MTSGGPLTMTCIVFGDEPSGSVPLCCARKFRTTHDMCAWWSPGWGVAAWRSDDDWIAATALRPRSAPTNLYARVTGTSVSARDGPAPELQCKCHATLCSQVPSSLVFGGFDAGPGVAPGSEPKVHRQTGVGLFPHAGRPDE